MNTKVAFAIAAALTGLFCVRAAVSVWPVVDGDSTAFFPAAVEWSMSRSLTNPLWMPPLNDSIDGPAGRRYTYHGFLYPLVAGAIARIFGNAPKSTVRAAYLIHWLAAITAALAVLAWADVSSQSRVVLAALLPFAMLGLSTAWHGRIEPLAILITGAGCLAWRWLPPSWREMAAGLACGWLFFTSPACGVLGGFVLAAAVANSPGDTPDLHRLASLLVGIVAAIATAIAAYPYPFRDWLVGLERYSAIVLEMPAGRGFVATWLLRPELPLLIVSVATVALLSGWVLVESSESLTGWRRTALAATVAGFSIGLARVALVKTEASYNAVVWIPLMACLVVSRRQALHAWLVILALAMPAAGLLRSSVILAAQSSPTAVSFDQISERLRQLAPADCTVSQGLWMASDHPAEIHIIGRDQAATRFLVLQQAYTGRSVPKPVQGYRLVENHFGGPVRILGVPISRTPGGWEFAVYERE